MDFPWAMLGLTGPEDAATIRRAYARQLKQTRAEVDPAGFMNLRRAYEAALELAAGAAGGYDAATDGRSNPASASSTDVGARPPVGPEPAARRHRLAELERRLRVALKNCQHHHEAHERQAAEDWVATVARRRSSGQPDDDTDPLGLPAGVGLVFYETAGPALARQLAHWPWPADPEPGDTESPEGHAEDMNGFDTPSPTFVLAAAAAFGWDDADALWSTNAPAGSPPPEMLDRARWHAWLAARGIRLQPTDQGLAVAFDADIDPAWRHAWWLLDQPRPPATSPPDAPDAATRQALCALIDTAAALVPDFWLWRDRAQTLAFWQERARVPAVTPPERILATLVSMAVGAVLVARCAVDEPSPLREAARAGEYGMRDVLAPIVGSWLQRGDVLAALLIGATAGRLIGTVVWFRVLRPWRWLIEARVRRVGWPVALFRHRWRLLMLGAGLCALPIPPGLPGGVVAPLLLAGLAVGGTGWLFLGLGDALAVDEEHRAPATVALGLGGFGLAMGVGEGLRHLCGGREEAWTALALLAVVPPMMGARRLLEFWLGRAPPTRPAQVWGRTLVQVFVYLLLLVGPLVALESHRERQWAPRSDAPGPPPPVAPGWD